jgi:hypothetical protein
LYLRSRTALRPAGFARATVPHILRGDAVGHPTTSGLSDFFQHGATFIAGINFPTEFLGETGKHSVTGMTTTRKFTPLFDGPGEAAPVEPPQEAKPAAGSRVVQYKMYEYFNQAMTSAGSTRGWDCSAL